MWIASSCTEFSAIWSAVLTGGAERMPTRSTRSGSPTAHSSACIPPIEPPSDRRPHVDAERVGQPHLCGDLVADREVREARRPLVAVRRDARRARSSPGSRPACSARSTNHRSVSMARTGADDVVPPALGRMPRAGGPRTWLSPVRACRTRTALSRAGLSSPHVSYARRYAGSSRPPSVRNGAERRRSADRRPGRRRARRRSRAGAPAAGARRPP